MIETKANENKEKEAEVGRWRLAYNDKASDLEKLKR